MSHDIANVGGRDLFASHRQVAWHGLGTVFEDEITDYRKMLTIAGLDNWNNRFAEVSVEDAPDAIWLKGFQAHLADVAGETRVLGITGDRYNIISNEESFEFLQSLHDGASFETAGALAGGRKVFATLAFERDFVLDENGAGDVVKSYVLLSNSHDGSSSMKGGITPVRVVCQNTLNVAMGSVKNTFSIRHSASAVDNMKAQAAMWRQANNYMDTFETEAKELFETAVTDKQFFDLMETVFPKPDADAAKVAVTKWDNKMGMFAQAWNGAPNAPIKNTAWGVFNALTEANQWGRNMQSREGGEESFYAAGAGFDAPTNAFRQNALSMAMSLV